MPEWSLSSAWTPSRVLPACSGVRVVCVKVVLKRPKGVGVLRQRGDDGRLTRCHLCARGWDCRRFRAARARKSEERRTGVHYSHCQFSEEAMDGEQVATTTWSLITTLYTTPLQSDRSVGALSHLAPVLHGQLSCTQVSVYARLTSYGSSRGCGENLHLLHDS